MQNIPAKPAKTPHEDLKDFIRSEVDSLRAELGAFAMELRSDVDGRFNTREARLVRDLRSALQARTIKLAVVMIVGMALFVAAVKLIPNVG